MSDEIKLKDVQRLDLQAGDVLVITVPGVISDDTARRVADHFQAQFAGHRVVVLSEGMELKAVRGAVDRVPPPPPPGDAGGILRR